MDARIARTRRSLQQAMLGLARERDLEAITIGDLVERAEVNRSSFYQHYSDKETLVADAVDALVDEEGPVLSDLLDRLDEAHAAESDDVSIPAVLVAYLAHFENNADLYSRVFGEHGSPVAMARMQRRVADLARVGLERSRADAYGSMPLDVAAAGLGGSVTGVLVAWLELPDRPPAAVAAEWMWQLLKGSA